MQIWETLIKTTQAAATRENDQNKAEIRKDKARRTRMIQQPPKGKDSHIGRYPEERGEVGEVQRKTVAIGKEKRPSTRRVKERQGEGYPLEKHDNLNPSATRLRAADVYTHPKTLPKS